MAFSKEVKDDITIIKIEKNRLDTIIASDLKSELLLTVDGGANKVLIDLAEVTYADSSGLGALLFGLRQLKNLGGQLKLFAANKKIMNLVRIARLNELLLNYDDKTVALKSFLNDQ